MEPYIKRKYIINVYQTAILGHTMTKRNARDKKQQKTIALSRIRQLFSMAEQRALSGNLPLANRYVELARKISMRHLVPIPKEYKRCFCKHCYSYLLPHTSCRMRIHRGKLVIYCHTCNKYTRIPLKNTDKIPSARLK